LKTSSAFYLGFATERVQRRSPSPDVSAEKITMCRWQGWAGLS